MSKEKTIKTQTKVFEPKILVFACNWCSYAGADNAGVSRIPYSPNVRLLRTMCSGRVHPSFVLDAFAKGADGVLISGCHFGDCHYMFGNYKAEEQYEKLTKLVNLLGIDSGRIGLEWISAAEGPRFAEVINGFVDTIRELGPSPLAKTNGVQSTETDIDLMNYHLYECLECGRCTGICPVARTNKFSPRRLLSRGISNGLNEIASDPSVWECLTCRLCENVCPSDIPYSELNKKLRSVSHELNVENTCTHGGVFEQVSTLMTRPGLKQNRLEWITKDLKIKKRESDTLFFTGCAPYFSAYFGDPYSETLDGSLRSAVKLMNRIGIEPLVLANELCCGHDLLLRGETGLFESLKVKVADQIKKTQVKRIVFTCPECLVTIRDEYSDLLKEVNIKYVHLSELLEPELQNLKFTEEKFTTSFQDPCRLGRYSNIYDQPREILNSIPGVEISELLHNRERTICCGNTAWIGCNAGTKELQKGKLQEILDTGSDNLLTACPKCFIHLKCAQNGTEDSPYKSIKINDIWNFVGSHLQ